MKFFNNIVNLFYPMLCMGCSSELLVSEINLCTNCLHNLPLAEIKNIKDNQIINRFYGRISIQKASTFLAYQKYGIAQKLIHGMKYNGKQEIGSFLGNIYGNQLKEQGFFNQIDCIIPVPLHPQKMKIRGYNQVTEFGKSLNEISKIEYLPNILQRISTSTTQTKKSRTERFSNKNTQFHLTDYQIFENKHVLLIDDVITTGATLEMCCQELLKTPNIKLSIATLASAELG